LRAALACLLVAGLGACAAGPQPGPASRLAPAHEALPPLQRFSAQPERPPLRSNREIAADILELGFFMESGRPIPQFSRFDGPVTVQIAGTPPAGAVVELDALIARLRAEARLDISLTAPGAGPGPRRITVEFLPRRQMQGAVPQAACFILPRVSGWEEFRAARRTPQLDWTTVVARDQVAVFVPSDVPPQELRDCLHEEVAQALGPLNDLYRLQESVWNDDNFQTVLTGFDMLVLRAWNDPALRPGMAPGEVAARLPAILARLNPAGERIAPGPAPGPTPRAWIDAVETALGAGASRGARRTAAVRALAIARVEGWSDARLAFSYFLRGRTSAPGEPDVALSAFLAAGLLYRDLPGGEVHLAHVDMQLAAFALSAGEFEQALALARRAQPAARASENAALLASLQMVQAEALERLGQASEARTVRLDSLGWARYGFGDDSRVRARLAEIAALAPPDGPRVQRVTEVRP
jgi:hypothetical protein